MRVWLLLLLILGNILIVGAIDRVSLIIGSSYVIDDRNISLVKADPIDDVSVFCVNGVKSIVSKERYKTVNDVGVDLISVKKNKIDADLTYRCNDCECVDCDNSVCFVSGERITIQEEVGEDAESTTDNLRAEDKTKEIDDVYVEPKKEGVGGVALALLIIVVIILGLVALWKKS